MKADSVKVNNGKGTSDGKDGRERKENVGQLSTSAFGSITEANFSL